MLQPRAKMWFVVVVNIRLVQNYGISTTAGGGVLGRLRSSTPSPSPSPTRRSRVGLGLGRGVLELKLHEVPTTDSSQVRWVQVQVHRGEAEVYLNLDEAYLRRSCTRRKASTPRRSRGVLVLPQNQHCCGVWWTPSTTLEHCWWGQRSKRSKKLVNAEYGHY